VLARCPNCRATFSAARTGRQDCPACGKPLFVPEPPPPAAPMAELVPGPGPSGGPPGWGGASAPGPEARPPPAGTPWELRPALPALEAWKQTLLLALFEPGKLFARARIDQGRAQLSFALWTGSVFWAIGQLLERFLLGSQREQLTKTLQAMNHDHAPPPWLQKLLEGSNENSPVTTILLTLLTPLMVFVMLYANAGITHLAALLLGQNRKGFAATFTASAYGMAPMVLFAIPGCGPLVALIWIAALTGIGLKYTHGMSTGAAASATLAPYLILCCLVCGMAMLAFSVLLPGFSLSGG
jgi:Yip1 domain